MPNIQYKSAADCITLSEVEIEIFELLRRFCSEANLKVTLRVAGGWVRDKLLGLECADLDIAIDAMMGRRFAELLQKHLISKGIAASAFGVIQANPERSKHLETATLRLLDHPIDFVNLRAESYSEESRIPVVSFGSPLEDTLRRDITINALFFNIHNEKVEDFCGTGLQDLNEGRIRTPLKPKETLLDDPLRLLRVIRFATRFSFTIDPELAEAISDPQVDLAFRYKISRERVGAELDKILSDKRALEGLLLMNRLGVFNLIFDLPHAFSSSSSLATKLLQDDAQFRALPDRVIVDCIFQMYREIIKVEWSLKYLIDKRIALLSFCLLPHTSVMGINLKGKPESLVTMILRDSLKFTNQDINDVSLVLSNVSQITQILTEVTLQDRLAVGRIIRKLGVHWPIAMHVSATHLVVCKSHSQDQALTLLCSLLKFISDNNLDEVWKMKGMLTGRDIQQEFGVSEGKKIGLLLEQMIDWQLVNHEGKKEDLLEFLKKSN